METQTRIRNEILKDAINHWREYAKQRKAEWKRSIRIEAKMNYLYLKQTIKHWREWSKQQYHNKNTIKYKKTMESMRMITIKRCLRYWHNYVESNYLSQKQYFRAAAYYNIKQQRQCIQYIQQLTQHKKRVNQIYQEWIEKNNVNNKQKQILDHYFNEWMKQYQYKRDKELTANAFYEKKLTEKIFMRFQKNTQYQRELQNKLGNVMYIRSNPENFNRDVLHIAYSKWKYNTEKIVSVRNNLNVSIKKDVLDFWRRNTMKQQRLKYFEQKIKIKHKAFEQRRKYKIFNEWKILVIDNQQSQLYLLSNYLDFWLKFSKKRHELTTKYEILNKWICMKSLHKIWLHWFLVTQDQIELNDKIEISIDFYSNKVKTLSFMSWKKFMIKNKKQKKLIKKIKNISKKSLKKRAFNHWFFIYSKYKTQKEIEEICDRYKLLKCIQFWHKSTKEKKHRKFMERMSYLFNIKLYFNKWLFIYEPYKIGNQYEEQITKSIKPFIDLRNKKILNTTFTKWKKKLNQNKEIIFLWNKSIIVGIVNEIIVENEIKIKSKSIVGDTVIIGDDEKELMEDDDDDDQEDDKQDTLNEIELSLKDLLYKKLNFRQNCQKFVKLKENNERNSKLEKEINDYLKGQKERDDQIRMILRDISCLYQYF